MRIEELRDLIEKHDFHCLEIYDQIINEICFHFETDDANKTICITYNRDKNGKLRFASASTVHGTFDFYSNYIEAMLVCGQCSYIKHHRGDKVVKLPKKED